MILDRQFVRAVPVRAEGQCTCSAYNVHLLDLLDWLPDPACPRHGIEARLARSGQTLGIDTSFEDEEG